MHQMTIRLHGEESEAFRRACRTDFRSVQQQARKYIVEGLRRDGFLDAAPEREERRRDP